MATEITTVTKTASVVKITKGSEKKWSEILSMNRRHDLQLPINIEKYNHEFKRTYKIYQRQQQQAERAWAHKHETWYQDDFLFRNHLLKQLKPITRRFKDINSLVLSDNPEPSTDFVLDEETEQLKPTTRDVLPPIKQTNKYLEKFHRDTKASKKIVLSKLVCSKMTTHWEPRLYSHHHTEFLDVAQRFLKHQPENLGKSSNSIDKQKQQKQLFKTLIDNEQERTRLATIQFGKQLDDEKTKENEYDDFMADNY